MSIIWKYLDKRTGAIEAIKDYGSMRFIINHTDKEIRTAYDKMGGVSSSRLDGMPHTCSPKAVEDRIIKGIEEIDVLKERYRQAIEYMKWFKPAWEQLSEDERYVLNTFYGVDNEYGRNIIYRITEHFHIEQSSAYNKKNRALNHLTVLLFGKS